MKNNVVIIGAGIAGLAAANHLRKHNIDYIILEARDRIGGRICVDKSLGIPIAKGASWIHGIEGNPLIEFLGQSTLDPFDPKYFYTLNNNGKMIPSSIINQFNQRFDIILDKVNQFAHQNNQDISLYSALAHYFNTEKLSADEKILYLKKIKFFENYIGADYHNLSAKNWNEEESLPGGQGILSDGYESILNNLKLDCKIQLNTFVKTIEIQNNHITITSNHDTHYASSVIVTIPISLLKNHSIQFIPELPKNKQQSIKRIGMGLFNIIAIKFPYVFWDNECHAYFVPENNLCSIYFNIGRFLKSPILVGYTGGNTAQELEKYSDNDCMHALVNSLKKYFGENIPTPEQFFITRWLADPFSQGSYSYLGVGATREDRNQLAEPIDDKIYFAGEATHRQHPATTHGAYLSGIKAAEMIAQNNKNR